MESRICADETTGWGMVGLRITATLLHTLLPANVEVKEKCWFHIGLAIENSHSFLKSP